MIRARPRLAYAMKLLLLGALIACAIVLWWRQHQHNRTPADIEDLLAIEGIPTAVLALRRHDGTVSVRVVGRGTDDDFALRPGAPLPIASLSKPITAAALRELVRQGRIELDEPIRRFLPDLPDATDARFNHITVRHLLQHTSGLNQRAGDPLFRDGAAVGCDHAIARSLQQTLESPPGQRMRYSNTGYCLAGRVIAQVTGQPYERAVQELLHITVDDDLTLGPPAGSLHDAPYWTRLEAAGGWFSDARTLVNLFSRDAQDPGIATSGATRLGDWYYGLGWRVWPRPGGYRLTHFGVLPGAFSAVVAHPDGRAAVVLMDRDPRDPEAFSVQLYSFLDAELARSWGPTPPHP